MEKFMRKMWKKSEGFTLVELIVVIAILGILAAVAVPAYSGYITKANDAAVVTELDAIKTAVFAATATDGAPTSIEVSGAGEVTYNNGTAVPADFVTFYSNTGLGTKMANSSYENGATWTGGVWSAVAANGGN